MCETSWQAYIYSMLFIYYTLTSWLSWQQAYAPPNVSIWSHISVNIQHKQHISEKRHPAEPYWNIYLYST